MTRYDGGGGGPDFIGINGFVGTYYVDRLSTKPQLGSQSNPFTTIAAAFAFAASVGVLNGSVLLNSNHTENVTFPLTGVWELAGINGAGTNAVSLTGTVDVSCTATQRRGITNLTINGNVSGNTGNATTSRVKFANTFVNGSVTLTATGTGFWRLLCDSPVAPNQGTAPGGYFNALTTVQGQIISKNWTFVNGVTFSGGLSLNQFFDNSCFLGNNFTFTCTGSCNLSFSNNCDPEANSGTQTLNFVSNVAVGIFIDDSSYSNFVRQNWTITGAGSKKTYIGNNKSPQFFPQTANGNIGASPFSFVATFPPCILDVKCVLTLLVPGTLGALTFNITYNDIRGVSTTKAVNAVPLNIVGVAGDEVSAQLLVSTDGSVPPTYSVTGVTTAGALSYDIMSTLEMHS